MSSLTVAVGLAATDAEHALLGSTEKQAVAAMRMRRLRGIWLLKNWQHSSNNTGGSTRRSWHRRLHITA